MKIVRALKASDNGRTLAMTIGNFDGVHIGHRNLLQHVAQVAEAEGRQAAAMTFEPHPLSILRPQTTLHRIGGLREKIRDIADNGIRVLYMPPFNAALAALPAEEFAALIFERLRVRYLLVGENFHFGRGGKGDGALLREVAARERGSPARVDLASLVSFDGSPVSSGRVRECIRRGDFAQVKQLLGRAWLLRGRVGRGDGRGRQWGFPTANLRLRFTPPCRGIFAARARVGDDAASPCYAAAVSIGVNPTVRQSDDIRVEAHLLDFAEDIYGKTLELEIVRKLREEEQYPGVAELKDAIADDVRQTRALIRV